MMVGLLLHPGVNCVYIVTKASLFLSLVLPWVCKATLGDSLVSCFALGSPNRICSPDVYGEGSDMGLSW